jgi:predicted RNase H-like HicB family nuclease
VAEMKTYTGLFHREGDSWVAEVREVPQAHTYGRTLARTQAYLREALALVLDVEENSFELHTQVHIDRKLDGLIDNANIERENANDVAERAKIATARAAVALVESGLSLRDAASALGLSFQRVNQIVHETPIHKVKKTSPRRQRVG